MKEIKEWLKRSERDLKVAKVTLREGFYDISGFLLQQATEKALKALYIKRFKHLLKTHNLISLAKQLNLQKQFLKTCDEINPFYIESRYPPLFVARKYTKKNISKLIKEVEVLLKWIQKNI